MAKPLFYGSILYETAFSVKFKISISHFYVKDSASYTSYPFLFVLPVLYAILLSQQNYISISLYFNKEQTTITITVYPISLIHNLHYEKFQDGTVKCIEDEIPFDVPEGWAWCRLKHICMMAAGKAKPTEQIKLEPFDGCYPCFGGNGIRGYVDKYNQDGIYSIVGRQGALCGNINIASGKFYATEHAVVTTIFSGIDFKWSNYILEALNLNEYATGAAQPGLSVSNVLNVLAPLAPSREQIVIGNKIFTSIKIIESIEQEKIELQEIISYTKSKILDLAIRGKLVPQDPNDEPASVLLEHIRAEKEKLIKQGKLKRDKKESVIFRGDDSSYFEKIGNDVFDITDNIPFKIPDTWMWCRLKCVAANEDNSFVDGPFGSDLKTIHYTEKEEVRIVQLNNIGEEGWKDAGKKYTTFLHAKNIERCISFPEDIVIAKMMPAGRTIILPSVNSMYVISSDCIRLRADYRLDKDYLMFMLNSPSINKFVLDNVQGIGRTRTSLNKMKDILIPVPPESEQQKISKMVTICFNYLNNIHNGC